MESVTLLICTGMGVIFTALCTVAGKFYAAELRRRKEAEAKVRKYQKRLKEWDARYTELSLHFSECEDHNCGLYIACNELGSKRLKKLESHSSDVAE